MGMCMFFSVCRCLCMPTCMITELVSFCKNYLATCFFSLLNKKSWESIYVVTYVESPFLLIALYHCIIWTFHSLFRCYLIHGYLECFQIVASRNRATIHNFVYGTLCTVQVFLYLIEGYLQEIELSVSLAISNLNNYVLSNYIPKLFWAFSPYCT